MARIEDRFDEFERRAQASFDRMQSKLDRMPSAADAAWAVFVASATIVILVIAALAFT